jgi:hypothetical protein
MALSREYSNFVISVRATERELLYTGYMSQVKTDKKIESEFYVFFPWENGPPTALLSYFSSTNQYIQDLITKN